MLAASVKMRSVSCLLLTCLLGECASWFTGAGSAQFHKKMPSILCFGKSLILLSCRPGSFSNSWYLESATVTQWYSQTCSLCDCLFFFQFLLWKKRIRTVHQQLWLPFAEDSHITSVFKREVFFSSKKIALFCFVLWQQICHRDLKLENTLLDGSPAPRLKICDFGYSKVFTIVTLPLCWRPVLFFFCYVV